MDELFVEIPVEEIDLELEPDIAAVEDELDALLVLDSSAETVAAAPALVPAVAAGTALGFAAVENAVVATVADGTAVVETTAVVQGGVAVLETGVRVAG